MLDLPPLRFRYPNSCVDCVPQERLWSFLPTSTLLELNYWHCRCSLHVLVRSFDPAVPIHSARFDNPWSPSSLTQEYLSCHFRFTSCVTLSTVDD
jgi:hypothetical protein